MLTLVVLLLHPYTSIVLFIGTIATQFMAGAAANQGNFAKARLLAVLTFVGATLIVVQNLAGFLLLRSAMALVMVALWSWIAWRDYHFYKRLPPAKR